jgi:hypothetical protein
VAQDPKRKRSKVIHGPKRPASPWGVAMAVQLRNGGKRPLLHMCLSGGKISRMSSRGSRFTVGVWGVRVCSLDAAFAPATVRNRSQAFVRSLWPCLWGVLQNVVPFRGFERCALFRMAGVALCDIPTCFITRRKSFNVTGSDRHTTFASFSKDDLHFSWQA